MSAPRNKRKKISASKPAGAREKAARLQPAVAANWPAILVVLAFTFLVYTPTLRFQFVYDDVQQIVQNPNIQSWSYLPDYFTKHLWSQLGWYQVRFYRPLFLLWLRTNHALFGLHASYWHLTTVAAHLLATLMVYVLVTTLLRNGPVAIFAALFFGLHPIHVEVAAWISASSEALLAAALMASLACYATAQASADHAVKKRWWVAGSLIAYAAALLMKETAMVFPAVIFVFSWFWFNQPLERQESEQSSSKLDEISRHAWLAIARTIPFLALTLIYMTVRWAVLRSIVTTSVPMGFKTIVFTVPWLLLSYGRLLLWPLGLSPFYDTPLVTQPNLAKFVIPVVATVAVACVMTSLFWKNWNVARVAGCAKSELRVMIFAAAWMLIFIVPALDLPALQNGIIVQDRYLYVPSVGFSILLALGLTRFGRTSRRVAGLPLAQVLLALLLAGMMAIGTEAQSKIWANNVALFTRAVKIAPENRVAQHDLAAALVDAGRYPDAIDLLQKLLRQDPNDPVDNNNLGQAYLNIGDREHAEVFLAKSCELHPTAKQLYQLGAVRFNLGRMEGAEQALREAIAIDPNAAGYHYALGLALERSGKPKPALDAFQSELAVHPADVKSQEEISRLTTNSRGH